MWNPFRKSSPVETNSEKILNTNIPLAPLMQPAGLPELNVIKYTTENPSIDSELQKEFFGFNPQQITFSDLNPQEIRYLMDELDIYEMCQDNFKFKFNVFRPDLDERRKRFAQFKNVIWIAALKAKDGQQRDKAYSSTSVSDTRIQAGALQGGEPKRERRGLAGIFLGKN